MPNRSSNSEANSKEVSESGPTCGNIPRWIFRLLAPSPLLGLAWFRSVDWLYFSPTLNAYVQPDILVVAFAVFSAIVCMLSVVKPKTAFSIAVLLFAAVKQAADGSISPPLLGMKPDGEPLNVLVTGANSGIGKAVSTELIRQGHRVILGCRSEVACNDVAAELMALLKAPFRILPVSGLELKRLDLVEQFTASVAATLRSKVGESATLDLIIANAGFVPLANSTVNVFPTIDVEEGLFAMYTGHHALLHFLGEASLLASNLSVVSVSSDAMRVGSFHDSLFIDSEEDITPPAAYGDLSGQVTKGCSLPSFGLVESGFATPCCIPRMDSSMKPGVASHLLPEGLTFGSYPRAKLANVLFARELLRRRVAARSTAVMPGIVCTQIVDIPDWWKPYNRLICPLMLRDASTAASVVLRAAVNPTKTHGPPAAGYHFFNGQGEALGPESLSYRSMEWMDRAARRLWELAEQQRALYSMSMALKESQ